MQTNHKEYENLLTKCFLRGLIDKKIDFPQDSTDQQYVEWKKNAFKASAGTFLLGTVGSYYLTLSYLPRKIGERFINYATLFLFVSLSLTIKAASLPFESTTGEDLKKKIAKKYEPELLKKYPELQQAQKESRKQPHEQPQSPPANSGIHLHKQNVRNFAYNYEDVTANNDFNIYEEFEEKPSFNFYLVDRNKVSGSPNPSMYPGIHG